MTFRGWDSFKEYSLSLGSKPTAGREEAVLSWRGYQEPEKKGLQVFPGGKFSTMFLFLSFSSSYIIIEMHSYWYLDGLCSVLHSWLLLFCFCLWLEIDLTLFDLLCDILMKKDLLIHSSTSPLTKWWSIVLNASSYLLPPLLCFFYFFSLLLVFGFSWIWSRNGEWNYEKRGLWVSLLLQIRDPVDEMYTCVVLVDVLAPILEVPPTNEGPRNGVWFLVIAKIAGAMHWFK